MSELTVPSIQTDRLTDVLGTGHPYETNLPAFVAHRAYTTTAGIVISAGGVAALTTYSNTPYNWHNMFDAITGQMTVPVTGLYMLSAHMSISHASLNHFDLSFFKAGVAQEPVAVTDKPAAWAAGGNWMTAQVNTCMVLSENDVVHVGFSAANVTGQTLSSTSIRHTFSAHLIKRL